jgi:hypothetical protein
MTGIGEQALQPAPSQKMVLPLGVMLMVLFYAITNILTSAKWTILHARNTTRVRRDITKYAIGRMY